MASGIERIFLRSSLSSRVSVVHKRFSIQTRKFATRQILNIRFFNGDVDEAVALMSSSCVISSVNFCFFHFIVKLEIAVILNWSGSGESSTVKIVLSKAGISFGD